jgi:hypothetical protein
VTFKPRKVLEDAEHVRYTNLSILVASFVRNHFMFTAVNPRRNKMAPS